MLCKALLQERPHLHVPASPRLCSADLRNIHERIRGRKTSLDPIMWHQRSLLFIDDLHEPAFGNSTLKLFFIWNHLFIFHLTFCFYVD